MSPKRVIVRFTNRKIVERILEKKKNEVYHEGTGFPAGFYIYFNENLCPQNKDIWMKARMPKKEKLLLYVCTDNSVMKIKHDLTSKSIKVKHILTLFEIFPNFKFQSKNIF